MRRWMGCRIVGIAKTRLRPVPAPSHFFGPWVVRATFVMALFGWGIGFYGPSIFLHTVVQRTGWGKSAVYFVATALGRAAGRGPTQRPRGDQRRRRFD